MSNFRNALLAGAAGSLTTNLLHEAIRLARRATPATQPPALESIGAPPRAVVIAAPAATDLALAALAADLVTNAGYFTLTRFAPDRHFVATGAALGLTAGVTAIALPAPPGETEDFTSQTPAGQLLGVAVYLAGGLVAGWMFRNLP